jgi:hypothetical protein
MEKKGGDARSAVSYFVFTSHNVFIVSIRGAKKSKDLQTVKWWPQTLCFPRSSGQQ